MGYAEGRSIENIIMSGNKSIYYPHELVHQFFPKHSKRYWLVDEGFATWLGGSMGKTYMERAAGYAKEYCKIDTASFDWAYKCEVLDCYPLGAILIDVVHEKAGDEGVLDLLKMDTETLPELYDAITNVTDWDKEQFNKKFEEKIIELSKVNMVN
ncbi:MAG: hypothetical protein HYV28_13915 [Ignavibacteriales bacterium]|nr:hypothetical protein [Ignavibacteriales bacterium]